MPVGPREVIGENICKVVIPAVFYSHNNSQRIHFFPREFFFSRKALNSYQRSIPNIYIVFGREISRDEALDIALLNCGNFDGFQKMGGKATKK